MYKQRGAAILIATFVVVLLGGAAFAGVGALTSDSGGGDTTPPRLAASDGTDKSTYFEHDDGKEEGGEPAEPKKEAPKAKPVETDKPSEAPKKQDKEEPADERLTLEVLSPRDGATVEEPVVKVKGLTHPRATVTFGDREAESNGDGLWWIKVELEEGVNELEFVARLGDEKASDTVTITYERSVEFSARQKWEVSDDKPATNIYYGTGTGLITISSKYGGAKVEADGEWRKKVTFDAPCDTAWNVKVSAATGESKTFKMKRVCPSDFTVHQKWDKVDGDPTYNYYHGTAKPNAEVWVGNDFGSAHTTANKDGKWELKVWFEGLPCNETVKVAAESGEARKTVKMKRVCGDEHEFSAHQVYGSCGEEIPYDVFYGTGVPGTYVHVESKYGGGKVKVNENGEWEIKVKFPDAPLYETFKVHVDGKGGEASFSFTATSGEEGDH